MPKPLASLCAAVAACTQVPTTILAYDWEIDLAATDPEHASDYVFDGSVRYFFSPLDPSLNAPWMEIDFVERIAFLEGNASYQETELDFSNYPPLADLDLKNKRKSIGGKLVHRNPNSRHSFSANIGVNEFSYQNVQSTNAWIIRDPNNPQVIQYDPSSSTTITSNKERSFVYGVGYDFYLADTWTVGAEAKLTEHSHFDLYTYSFNTNRLWKIGSQQWLGLEARIDYEEGKTTNGSADLWSYHFEGRYYLSPKTGFTAGISFPEDEQIKVYTLSAHHFFTESFFLEASASHSELDLPPAVLPNGDALDLSSTDYQVRIGLRF